MANSIHLSLVLICACCLHRAVATTATIVNFTQSSEVTRPGGNISFYCEATGDEVEWRINYSPKYRSYDQYTINYSRITPGRWGMDLIVLATSSNNGTSVMCYTSNSVFIEEARQIRLFIIADPPLRPAPIITTPNATHLIVTWEEPFSVTEFPITGYRLAVTNKSSGVQSVLEDFNDTMSYSLSMNSTVDNDCHVLNFSMTAYNDIGATTGSVLGMFPKVPDPVEIVTDLSFSADGVARLAITSQHRNACSYHEAEYIIRVITTEGEVIREARSDQLNENNEFEEQLNSGLVMGQTYTITAIGRSPAGNSSLQANITIELKNANTHVPCASNLPNPLNGQVEIEAHVVAVYTCSDTYILHGHNTRTCMPNGIWSGTTPTCDSVSTDKPVSSLTFSLGLSVGLVVVILFLSVTIVGTIIGVCVVKQRRKKSDRNSVTIQHMGANALDRPARPTNINLQSKCATNPIYDSGPVYETPTGESFKCLLDRTPSTPNTPSSASPRYFDMPPCLPAPRKTSVCNSNHSKVVTTHPLQSTVDQVEKIQQSFNIDVPTPEDEYTIMNPITTGRPSRFKPSPLIFSTPANESNDVYVTVN